MAAGHKFLWGEYWGTIVFNVFINDWDDGIRFILTKSESVTRLREEETAERRDTLERQLSRIEN